MSSSSTTIPLEALQDQLVDASLKEGRLKTQPPVLLAIQKQSCNHAPGLLHVAGCTVQGNRLAAGGHALANPTASTAAAGVTGLLNVCSATVSASKAQKEQTVLKACRSRPVQQGLDA
jgi:hypothetical protein